MIVSRCKFLSRLPNIQVKGLLSQNGKSIAGKQIKRHSHSDEEPKFFYRKDCDPPKSTERLITVAGSFMWWWVLWHMFTDYHELLPMKMPDPSKWTDEELGVPPLEE